MTGDLDVTPSAHGDWALRVDHVVKEYRLRGRLRGRRLRAVDDVTFTCGTGETIGLVGESGCGKTTLGKMIAGLVAPTRGTVSVGEPDAGAALRPNPSWVQMVYQNPSESLDPRWTVRRSVAEPLVQARRSEQREVVEGALASVGLPGSFGDRKPHELSGGQQQRACIARAIVANPAVIVLDEAVSGLDVLLQQDVIALLQDLQAATGVSYVFISHDLAAVEDISSRLLVMYLGRVVESGTARQLADGFLHPYATALYSAQLRPLPDGSRRMPIVLRGEPPSAMTETTGCHLASRCPLADDRCRAEDPALSDAGDGHVVACHHPGELAIDGSIRRRSAV